MRRRFRRGSAARRTRRRSLHWKIIYKKVAEARRKTQIMQCIYGRSGGESGGGGSGNRRAALETIERLAGETAVVVFSVSTCCMCHVVKSLFCSLGVNPTVYELDELEDVGGGGGKQLREALAALVGELPVPAVFIGGKLVGGLDHVMAAHISGSLKPLLREAGALWL
ncbi:hypothetical protein KP509_06G037900 [Ceratopteris richardii]|uniref:Glutaredoxin domain-containing protein n=1 Tax=Ceratopteris richardii TaxID=49495 RepID=A0A8T2UH83_CERRI|nr:hypothetical protein KP509_06G037900 [Ceratopteris richardii]